MIGSAGGGCLSGFAYFRFASVIPIHKASIPQSRIEINSFRKIFSFSFSLPNLIGCDAIQGPFYKGGNLACAEILR